MRSSTSRPETSYAVAIGEFSTVLAYEDKKRKETHKGDGTTMVIEKPSTQRLMYSNPIVRRLVIEMHAVFVRSRENAPSGRQLSADSTLEISRRYRSVLLNAAISSRSEHYARDFELWSFYEAIYLKRGDGNVCADLMTWARESFIFVQKMADEAICELEDGVELVNGKFWQAVALSLICCRFDICSELLILISGNQKPIEMFIDLLAPWNCDSIGEKLKDNKLEAWQESVRACLKNRDFASNDNLAFLSRILLGEDKLIKLMTSRLELEWWHVLPFYLFTKNSSTTLETIAQVADDCRQLVVGDDDDVAEMDVFYCVATLDEVNFYRMLAQNSWLSVHILDLAKRSTLDPDLHEIHAFYVSEYATGLISHSSLWEIGFDYMMECGSHGLLFLENHIEAMPIESEETAEKLLEITNDYGLQDSRNCVTNTMTNRYLSGCHWSAALSWALRSESKSVIDTAVRKIVAAASEDELASLSMLDSLPDSSILSLSSLTFLFSMHRFMQSLKNRDVKLSVENLIPLLMIQDVPPEYHYNLFDYLILILKNEQNRVYFPRELLYELSVSLKSFIFDKETLVDENYTKKVKSLQRLVMLKLAESIIRPAC